MAGDDEHVHRFDYARNANLVLHSDGKKRGEHDVEDGSEIGSLWGRINPLEFGAKAERERPKLPSTKRKPPSDESTNGGGHMSDALSQSSSLTLSELATLKYRPRTQETRSIYERMLKLVMDLAEEESGEMGRALLDEALIILCSSELRELEQRSSLEALLMRPMESLAFSQLLALSKRLVDWNASASTSTEANTAEAEEESFGLTVVEPDHLLNDDDDDGGGEASQYLPDIKEDPEENIGQFRGDEETEIDPFYLSHVVPSEEEQGDMHLPKSSIPRIDIRDIDVHYLQRLLSLPGEDAWVSHSRSKAVLALLQDRTLEGWILEGRILKELCKHHSRHENPFELLSLLVSNRMALVAGIALAEADPLGGDGEAKEAILQQLIAEGPEGAVLAALVDTPRTTSAVAPFEKNSTVDASSVIASTAPSKSSSSSSAETLAAMARDARDAQTLAARRLPLPPGSWRRAHAGYELIHVPAPPAIPAHVRDAPSLCVVEALPSWTHGAWEGQPTLNRIQSAVLAHAFFSDQNLLVSAPTGAGKTGIAILALLRLFGSACGRKIDFPGCSTIIESSDGETVASKRSTIAVYIAPMRALVSEITATFRSRFLESGLWDSNELAISELTGESGGGLGALLAEQGFASCRLIVATPEKWDIVSRKPAALIPDLLIVDEVHLIGDAPRGTALEAIVARSLGEARIVALSATLPNAEQVGSWLRARVHCFGGEWRPCPLSLSFYGVMERKVSKRMAKMNEILLEEVIERLPQGPILVFVHSRRETARTARLLRDGAATRGLLALFHRAGGNDAEDANDSAFDSAELGELMPAGIGIHHAGLSRQDRGTVERLFGSGQLSVLVSTATLAWGVNLPAHTVIIKGTEIYDPGTESGSGPAWTLLSSQDLLQMWGRAGRPQFDRHGEALLLTSHENLSRYVAVTAQPVLSQMLTTAATDGEADGITSSASSFSSSSCSMMMRILPHLAAEVARSTLIRSMDDACAWISDRLFLGQMVRDDPAALGIDPQGGDPREWIVTLASASMALIRLLGLVEGATASSSLFHATPLGEIASFFYIAPATIRTILHELRPQGERASIAAVSAYERVLSLLSRTMELAALSRIREEEQGALDRLASLLPVPMERTHKAALLLQAVISRVGLEDGPMAMDAAHVAAIAPRLLRAIFEIAVMERGNRGGGAGLFAVARAALLLARSVELRCWPTCSPVIQLLDKETTAAADLARLERRELNLAQLRLLTPGELAALIPQKIDLSVLPSIEITASAIPLTQDILRVDVAIQRTESHSIAFWLFLTDLEDEKILHHQRLLLRETVTTATLRVPIGRPVPPAIMIHVLSDRFHHCDVRLPISFRALQLPADEEVPLKRIEQLAPVSLEQVRALYMCQANVTDCMKTDTTSPDHTVMLSAVERHVLWLLRLECSPLVVGLPFSLLADAATMVRLLEFGIGLTIACEQPVEVALIDDTPKVKRQLVLATSPWRGRRVALGRTLAALFEPGQLLLDEKHSLPSALASLFENADHQKPVVAVGEVTFLFGLLRAVSASSFPFSVRLVMEWGVISESQMLYQELLLTEIHALADASVSLLVAPATMPSLRSLGRWVGTSPGRLLRLPHRRPQASVVRFWRVDQNEEKNSAFLPLLPLIEDNGPQTSRDSVLLCVADEDAANALAATLMRHVRCNKLSLATDADAIAELIGDGADVKCDYLEWLAAGIAYAADPLGWTAFNRGLLPILITPLSMVGEVIASTEICRLKQIIAWQTAAVLENACMFGLGLAMGAPATMGPVLFSCESQGLSTSMMMSPGESVLMPSLAMALPAALLASNAGDEATLQAAMDYICQHSWLLERMRANPNFYHLTERSEIVLAERLSEALESALDMDEEAQQKESHADHAPATLARVATHYGLSDELLRTMVWPNILPTTRAKSLLAILSQATVTCAAGHIRVPCVDFINATGPLDVKFGVSLLSAVVDICLLKSSCGEDANYLSTALAAMDLVQALRQGCKPGRADPVDVIRRQLGLTPDQVQSLISAVPLGETPSLYELALYVREPEH
ncbi:Pre-mRNA-splicing helicase BRR2 [Mitosporidium daphniae]